MRELIKDVEHGRRMDSAYDECLYRHLLKDSAISIKEKQISLLKDTLAQRTVIINVERINSSHKDDKIKQKNKTITTMYAIIAVLAALLIIK